jgi:hypothetical protein
MVLIQQHNRKGKLSVQRKSLFAKKCVFRYDCTPTSFPDDAAAVQLYKAQYNKTVGCRRKLQNLSEEKYGRKYNENPLLQCCELLRCENFVCWV